LNKGGVFTATADTALNFPARGRPSITRADFLNDGTFGLFVTANERHGVLMDWQMIGTFSADEDKKLAVDGDFNPEKKPTVKIGEEEWNWRPVRARANGVLEAGRSETSPNACYAFATFESEKAEKQMLYFGSENGLAAWLNGKPIYDFKEKRPYSA